MLSQEELKRRIEAARILRGYSQDDLAKLLEADGLGKHDLGRIERGTMTMQRVHRDAIVRHLRIPEYWLTHEDVDVVVGLAPPPRLNPSETRELLARLLAGHDQAADPERPGTPTRPADGDRSLRAAEGGDA